MKHINGGVYKDKETHRLRVLLYFRTNKKREHLWMLLNICRHDIPGMSAPALQFCNDKHYFTEKELIDYFDFNKSELLDGRLRIEKIDDMSLVEYTNGELEKLDLRQATCKK